MKTTIRSRCGLVFRYRPLLLLGTATAAAAAASMVRRVRPAASGPEVADTYTYELDPKLIYPSRSERVSLMFNIQCLIVAYLLLLPQLSARYLSSPGKSEHSTYLIMLRARRVGIAQVLNCRNASQYRTPSEWALGSDPTTPCLAFKLVHQHHVKACSCYYEVHYLGIISIDTHAWRSEASDNGIFRTGV
ncbi:hypothetical protein GGS21DRAFT_532933 [Xylaria nigripes]|nr:hypothetical protein GGS21DRAFT_532933 [Xylaria nigripes]